MKLLNRKPLLLSLALLLVLGLVTMSALAQIDEEDCTVTHGEYLGENYIYHCHHQYATILGRRLNMHNSPDLTSSPIYTLEAGMDVEVLEEQAGAFMVRYATLAESGEVIYYDGWVDSRFVIEKSELYIAMHPTVVYISPNVNAKLLMIMNTYDCLQVVEEYDDFYAVLVRGGIGYVEKEQQQEEGA